YERMTSAYGDQINYLSLKYIRNDDYIKRITKEQDAIFLCHPNNPTGEIYEESILENILGYCKKNNCYLILDEAFYDFSDEVYSMAQKVHYSDHLIILRSVTKMFSIAGIRLGYLFAGKELIKQLRAFQPYWSVNALALKIGELVVNEDEFVEESQKYIKRLRGEIFPEIKELGFLLSNSKVNFFLLRDPILDNQKDLLIFLLKKGIVPRHTENYPFLEGKYLRFAIRPDNEMQELLEVLKEWKNN
ncbi:MAG: aminotransferase class I/II-fold pyridoxal phosphate-dependent enzyme, partial [Atopostipes sp.]|nr:aminotransferase class I/II-fold pyridoxal phosphate-dependent enzyme [Atopostipes sp.]